MKRYDVYRITSPEYEDPWFSGGQVVVYKTYEDGREEGPAAERRQGRGPIRCASTDAPREALVTSVSSSVP